MTNAASPIGLKLLNTKTSNVKRFYIDTDVSTAVFAGDQVHLMTDAGVTQDFPEVELTTSSSSAAHVGAVLSCYDSNGVELTYIPASTAGYVDVETDPLAEYEIQSGADGTALTQAAIGDTANGVYTAGSIAYGRSRLALSESLSGAGAPRQWRIIGKIQRPVNDWGQHYIQLRVIAALHAYVTMTNAI